MEERRVAEYFVVAGLPANPQPLADFSCEGATLKSTHNLPPITDIAVINRSLGEVVPDGYTCIEKTPSDLVANLNHGALRAPEMFLCYRRGRDKQPLVDIGVLYEGRERVMADSQIVEFTHGGRNANINPSGQTTYMTYRRASDNAACNELMVSDICVIMTNRGDQAPHSYCTIDRNLNKGTMVGSDIYVCYKKSMNRSNYIAFIAGVLDHFPFNHRPGFPIPSDLALFCLPMGATLESWPAQAVKPQPVFSTFVLTVTAGEGNTEAVEKVYGAAVTFYEKFSHNRLTQEQRETLKLNEHFGRHNIVHTNKCICILSRWPFFDTFDRFLKYLHNMANSGPHTVPIERYIYHFLECVPFPSARRPRILIQLDAKERISLAQPEDSPISLSGAKFRQLVMNLRPEGCLTVLLFALTEQKILLHSLRPDVLTAVAEAISMIIFPFHWQCPYIPLCPLGLSDFLNAPIPFLLGLDSRFFDLYDPPADVICIDLDTGAMSVPDDKKYLITKILPSRATRTLRASLECLCEKILKFEKSFQQHLKSQKNEPDGSIDSDFKMKRKEHQLDVEIQEAFLRFTATILKGYSAYLLPIVSAKAGAACDTSSLFDLDAFVKSRDKKYHRFYQLLVNTQMFSKFIEERSFVSDKDASLAFFDDCAEKVIDEDASIRLLEVEMAQSEHTLFLPPPEPVYLPEGVTYTYAAFPKLKPELFPLCEPKPVLPPKVKAPQTTPASPLARRTKQEVKTDQRLASRYSQTPILWAKCLLSTCYSLWFTHLPAFASTQHHKARFLQLAFKILTNMQKLHLSQADEVSYRVMMQLCGLYSQPILAVKVLCEMRQHGITPNAITYGYYNRAVMENKWTHSNLFWNKLRNVVIGVSAFKRSGMERAQRRKSSLSLDVVDKCLTDADSASRVSLESGTSLDSHPPAPHAKTDTLSSDPGYCSVSETSESVSSPGAPPTVVTNSAGLLMTSALDSSVFNNTSRTRQRPTDLADALSPTLDQYDKMSEATAVRTSPETPISAAQEKVVPEYLSNSSSRLGLASNIASVGLRQATKQIGQLRSQYIDPAMADLGQYSPGNFNYRKNELISGGLSSVKSAVTSISKKYNEIRDAISATNTPVRGAGNSRMCDGDGDEDSLDGFWSRRESADVQGVAPLEDPGGIIFGGVGASSGSEGEAIATQQDLFPPLGWDPTGPFCLGLWLTSCTRCHNCTALLYDEEIMAGWRPDDSNLNTKCTFCEKMTVPLLTITVYDLRQEPRPMKETEDPSESGKPSPAPTGGTSDGTDRGLPPEEVAKDEGKVEQNLKDYVGSQLQKKGIRCEPITVPYLSPLVLRKELETVLGHEGDTCLTDTAFTDHHPILYWNLLWYFCRLRVPSHLPGLCLSAATVARDRMPHASWEGADWQNVYVRCLWDNAKYHEELGQPMYIQWQQDKRPSPLVSALVRERTKVSRDVMQSVITALHMDDITTAMKLVLQELRKRPSSLKKNHFPIYRDLLFFASSCIPPAQLNLTSFDREYRRAHERNEQSYCKLLSRSDTPPPIAAVFCRRYFSQLSL